MKRLSGVLSVRKNFLKHVDSHTKCARRIFVNRNILRQNHGLELPSNKLPINSSTGT